MYKYHHCLLNALICVLQVLGNTKSVAGVSQLLEDPADPESRWQNVVAFGEGNQLVIEAELEGIKDESSFFYRFSGGFFKLKGTSLVALSH